MMLTKKRILFVSHGLSLHIRRWIDQFSFQNKWEVFIFSTQHGIGYDFDGDNEYWAKTHHAFKGRKWQIECGRLNLRKSEKDQLCAYILSIQPHIIHSFVVQGASHLVLEAKNKIKANFPPWITTSMGSDLSYYGRKPGHSQIIKMVLSNCEYHFAECHRDIKLAANLGFKGKVLDILPGAGGLNLNHCRGMWTKGTVSERKYILLKGYQNDLGRALVALKAIESCSKLLKNFKIGIFGASPQVVKEARALALRTKLKIEILPWISHEKHLTRLGTARIYLGLSIADGICMSLLEAMAMGAFPIQSNSACTLRLFTQGEGGFRVKAEDAQDVANKLSQALLNDNLVCRASILNFQMLKKNMDQTRVATRALNAYEKVSQSHGFEPN